MDPDCSYNATIKKSFANDRSLTIAMYFVQKWVTWTSCLQTCILECHRAELEQERRWLTFGLLHRAFWNKFTDVSEAIALTMVTASASETSVNFYESTRRNNPEDSHVHTRHRESLKFHLQQRSTLFPFHSVSIRV
jgi:hypothetical protein